MEPTTKPITVKLKANPIKPTTATPTREPSAFVSYISEFSIVLCKS